MAAFSSSASCPVVVGFAGLQMRTILAPFGGLSGLWPCWWTQGGGGGTVGGLLIPHGGAEDY